MTKPFRTIAFYSILFSLLITSTGHIHSGGVQPKSLEAGLVEAIDAGDATRVADLLARGADPLAVVEGVPCLKRALVKENFEVVLTFFRHNESLLEFELEKGIPIWVHVVRFKESNALKEIFKEFGDRECFMNVNRRFLAQVISVSSPSCIKIICKKYIKRQSHMDVLLYADVTPLCATLLVRNLPGARALLELGARPDGSPFAPSTPLHKCALMGLLEGVDFLIESGADVNRTSVQLRSMFSHFLNVYGVDPNESLLVNLLDASSDDEIYGQDGIFSKIQEIRISPLSQAIKSNHVVIARKLHQHGARLQPCDEPCNLLCFAAQHGDAEFINQLIEDGEDPLQRDAEGKLPAWYALNGKHKAAYKALKKAYPPCPNAAPKTFDDILGCEAQKAQVREAIELFLHGPATVDGMSSDSDDGAAVKAPRGILLCGPPGTGKTSFARVAAREYDCAFFEQKTSDIGNCYINSGQNAVRDMFKKARSAAADNSLGKCILFIDEIDAIARRRDTSGNGNREYKDDVVVALLQEMNEDKNPSVLVFASTNHREILDYAIRRRFSRCIELDLPSEEVRRELIERRLNFQLALSCPQEFVDKLIKETRGFSAADIADLLSASLGRNKMRLVGNDRFIAAFKSVKERILGRVESDFFTIRKCCYLSSSNATAGVIPDFNAKIILTDAQKREIENFLDFVNRFDLYCAEGVTPRGNHLIFAGPPGTGKSYLAELLSDTVECTFIHITAPLVSDILVRKIFNQIRNLTPCIVFIDEIDSIGAINRDGDTSGSNSKPLNALLQEIEGLSTDKDSLMMLVGATNRIAKLDRAFDDRFKVINFSLPSNDQRQSILRVHSDGSDRIDWEVLDDGRFTQLLTEATQGLSGRKLGSIINTVIRNVIRESVDRASCHHFAQAIAEVCANSKPQSEEHCCSLLRFFAIYMAKTELTLLDDPEFAPEFLGAMQEFSIRMLVEFMEDLTGKNSDREAALTPEDYWEACRRVAVAVS